MRILPLVLLAGLGTACVRTTTNPATGRTDVDVESPTQRGEDWKGPITGQGSFTAISGSSQAQVSGGKTMATVQIKGATAGGVHPWHIHEGKCGSGGPIVGSPAAYTPLTVGQDGSAAGNATVDVQLNEAKDYYVNVHASPDDLPTIVACGDLDD